MNILMISDVYFPRVNGVSTSIQTFRRQLERLGHQVTLHVGVRLSRRLNIPRVESYHTFFEEYLYHYVPVGKDAARQGAP